MENNYELVEMGETMNDCSICLEKLKNNLKILTCGHKLHVECFQELEKNNINRCPLCKNKMFQKKIPIFKCCFHEIKASEEEVRNYLNKTEKYSKYFLYFIMICILFLQLIKPEKPYFNYCDNKYVKCDYYQTVGILNETKPFFNRVKNTYIYENNTCKSIEMNNDFKNKLGEINKIYVSNKNSNKCLTKYENYDPKNTKYKYLYLSGLFFVILFYSIFIFLRFYICKFQKSLRLF